MDLHTIRNAVIREIGWHFQDEQEFLHGIFSVILNKDVHLKNVVGSASGHRVSLENARLDNRPHGQWFLDSRSAFHKWFEFAHKGIFQYATLPLDLAESLNISFDSFIRTTEQRHRRGVAKFWKRLGSEDVYTQRYAGLYCVGCEHFYLDKDLVRGLCPDHGTAPKRVEEENYFFRLSAYQQQLERLIESGEIRIVPTTRRNEVLRFIRSGLQDISISRPSERPAAGVFPSLTVGLK